MIFRCLAVLFCLAPVAGMAQKSVPDHRYIYTRDVDFVGPDLANLFDTSRDACERACSAQPECSAFTFNARSNACFPKSGVKDHVVYDGAFSAVKVATPQDVKTLSATRRGDLDFLRAEDFDSALRLVKDLPRHFPADELSMPDVVRMIGQSQDVTQQERWISVAVSLTDSSTHWVDLSWLRAPRSSNRAWHFRQQAVPAAVNGYLRADAVNDQVNALWALAKALEDNDRGRDMISALRIAEDLNPGAVTDELDAAIAKYGFRVTDHQVDSDSAAPRICAVFSERLASAGVDYDPYVRASHPALAVQAEENQLCLDGVEHGQRYKLTLRAGLPAASGETLRKDVDLVFYVRDRAPAVRFSGRSFVLPKSAGAAIPVDTVNVDTLDLTLRRVSDRNLVRSIKEDYFGRPLMSYQTEQFAADLAQEIWTGVGEVQNTLNTDMTTRLPLGDALRDQAPGVYALSASVPGQDPEETAEAMQWFVLTDLGLSSLSGVDGLHVTVLGMGDAQPRAGVKLSLISRANGVLGETTTDDTGVGVFPAGLSRGTGSARPALVIAETGDDFAFLPLTDPAFDLSDRGVEGRPPSPPVDTFVTTDRGIYRVGETIFVTALARDAKAQAVTGLPLIAVLKRPDGVEYSRQISQQDVAGGHVFSLPLGRAVPRGAWRLDVFTDPDAQPVASKRVLVEDFLAERIDFDLTLPDAPLVLGSAPRLQIDARYLFGAPGADLAVNGKVALSATRSLAGYDGYLFGRYDEYFDTQVSYFKQIKTDAAGRGVLALTFPNPKERPTQLLEAQVSVELSEGSGRPVGRKLTKAVAPDAAMIGVKPLFDDMLGEGADAGFSMIAVGGDTPVRWTLNSVNTRYQWYQVGGRWQWEPIVRRTRIDTGEVVLTETPFDLTLPTEWGEYELVVEGTAAPYGATSVSFSSGWYGNGDSSATPDRLEVGLDQPAYDAGDTARLRVVAPDAGTLLVSVLSNRVVERKLAQVSKGENLIPLSVTADWGSSAYVSAMVIRPMDAANGQAPARSLGVAHAKVRPAGKQLQVTIDAPDSVDGQDGSFTADVTVSGDTQAYVTLAAVDLGILNMTGFTAPDAAGHYFGQRRLGVELRDVYGRLINGLDGAMGRVRSGGGAAPDVTSSGPPPQDAIMTFFSGPVAVGPDGKARIEVERPAFNGTIKLMAVAWSDTGVGNAAAETLARDPVVVTPSLPRQLSPGDESRLLLELVHADGPAGKMDLAVAASGGVTVTDVPAHVTLDEGGSARLTVPVRAVDAGNGKIEIALTLPGGAVLTKKLNLPIRAKDPAVSTVQRVTLGAGQQMTFDDSQLSGLYDGALTISAGPLAKLRVPQVLQQLDRYPYGCTEQVASAVMPLLYLGGLADQMGLGAPSETEKKIAEAVDQVLARQGRNGGFGLWSVPRYEAEPWLDAYVTDFLFRAKEQGHDVPAVALAQAMDNLRNRVNVAADFDDGGEDLAYALWVLAQAGAANIGDLRYYADEKAGAFGSPLALAQLGAALAAYGDTTRAQTMFAAASSRIKNGTGQRGWRSDFGSDLRDAAAVLRLSAEAGSPSVLEPLVVDKVSRADILSTQEAAQVAMAAYALGQSAPFELQVDGVRADWPVVAQLEQGAVTIANNGGPVDLTIDTYGVPKMAPMAGGYGYAIDRRYFTLDGTEVLGPVQAGTRMVVVLTVSPFEKDRARLMIDDALPGGLEIDNPNLLGQGAVKALDWLTPQETDTAEFRADRFLAAVTYAGNAPFQLAYMVRAVTPGVYHHPAALVEDMYRPRYRANSDSGTLTVTD